MFATISLIIGMLAALCMTQSFWIIIPLLMVLWIGILMEINKDTKYTNEIALLRDTIKRLEKRQIDEDQDYIVCPKCNRVHAAKESKGSYIKCACGDVYLRGDKTWYSKGEFSR